MKLASYGLSFLAAGLVAAQPCAAAELEAGDGSRRSGMFAGAYVRVPLGPRGPAREEARAGLSFASTHVYRGADASGGERRLQADIVDIGMFRSGRPSLMVAGRQLVDERGRLSLKDGGGVPTWAIVVGAVVLAAGVGYLVLMERLDCDEDEECN